MASMVEPRPAGKDQPRGRHRHARRSLLSPIRKFHSESLFRNSVFLVLNLSLGAGCGYGGLLLLTRLFAVQAVGLSATAASASALIVFVMQFGINFSLPRFLPTSQDRTALINTVLTIIIFATLLGAAAYLMLPFAGRLYALGGWLFAVTFLIGACVQAGESAFETILVAERSSSKLARGNAFPNLIKLAAPAIFVFLGALGAYISRVVAFGVGFVVLGIVLARRGHRFRASLNIAALRDLGRFSAGMYIASLIGSLPLMIIPIIILSRFGFKQSAYWSIAITIASLLYQLPGAVSQALLPEVAARPSDRRNLLRRAAALILAMVVPVLVVAYIAAPLALASFGHNYASGSLAILRWLIIAGLITILNYVTGAILFLAKKTLLITMVNIIDAVIVLGMTAIWARDAREVAISWVIGDIANTVLFGVFALLALHQVQGRWEALGDASTGAQASVSESPASAMDLQRRGVEALVMLAEAQQLGPWQGAPTVPFGRVRDSFGIDSNKDME
jgi:O-antigen/teichoic acid export membrane protein